MMIADFHPALLTPLSQSAEPRNERLTAPHAPRPGKRCSERVSSLLMDNLELLQTPLSGDDSTSASPNKKRCLQLHPRGSSDTLSSALFQNAMERLRQKGESQVPTAPGAPRRIVLSPKRRHVPTLPEPARRGSNSSTSDHSIKHDMERTPIRNAPERSNSGLARCA